ncbi:acetyltransferase [Nocardiopsis sp. TSRI0078]|uniref:GNAT family N-acetyltransferase n=1 Tax=unclassified Nocardiopsis TaxID=2649073 RepID=UPI00096930E1|nr:GNAT family N-acetyltransferase [Nocardiopsis sp. TSRI0078]OKI18898.1 acetyltransferase [Nocardiopsis sp. TSRI0078]
MRPEDTSHLVEVSLAADTVFAGAGVVLPPDDPGEMLAHAERVLVADDPVAGAPVVGLAATVTVDGRPHLEQLAVHPDHGRRGVGGALLEAVCAEAAAAGHTSLTLTTFRDLPWNGPWYADRGFAVLPRLEWGPGLEGVWEAEERAGIRVLPRVVMVRDLSPPG